MLWCVCVCAFLSVGVGSNLQDHLELYVQQQCSQPITLYKAQKPFHMVKIGLEWLLQYTGITNKYSKATQVHRSNKCTG